MHLRTQNRREGVGPERPRVGYRKVVDRQEVVCQGDEIVAGLAVGRAHGLDAMPTVGSGGMAVKIAAVELPRLRESPDFLHALPQLVDWP